MCCNSPTVPSQHKGPRVFWKNLLCKNKNTKKVIRGNWRRQTRFRRGHIQKRIITNQYPCEVYLWCFSVLFQMQRRSHVSQSATRACLSVRPQTYPGTWDTHSLPPTGRQKMCFYKKLLYFKKKLAAIFFFYCTLVPTPGRVRRASRASRYGTVRRLSSHWGPWVSSICLALCCRKRALYPKPRSLRRASMPLSDD